MLGVPVVREAGIFSTALKGSISPSRPWDGNRVGGGSIKPSAVLCCPGLHRYLNSKEGKKKKVPDILPGLVFQLCILRSLAKCLWKSPKGSDSVRATREAGLENAVQIGGVQG